MKIRILYYSGTGSTKLVAEALSRALIEQDPALEVSLFRIWRGELPPVGKVDRLIVLYPVHAANAPRPVLRLLRCLLSEEACLTTLVCVSAGGECLFNNGCREAAKAVLLKRGYPIISEHHIIMPANIFKDTPFLLACELMKVLPGKVKRIAADVLGDLPRQLPSSRAGRKIAKLAKIEQKQSWRLAKSIKVSDACVGCGKCADLCPEGNIHMEAGQPRFAKRCAACMACLLGCPQRALKPGLYRWAIPKQGYPLAEWQEAADIRPPMSEKEIRRLAQGPWRALANYLLHDDSVPAE
ncbi:MAG TPA: 4Fe-4S binding protein [Clostridiales bacterium]|nr:4Fe-4S binding protein [Clostridiales bacterium]